MEVGRHSLLETKFFGLTLPIGVRTEEKVEFEGVTYQKAAMIEYRFNDMMNFLRGYKYGPGAKGGFASNAQKFQKDILAGEEGFKGGTYAQLIAPHTDFEMYNEAMAKLSAQEVWKKAAKSFADVTTRKRTRCQYDGEFDFDKRWDAEPFQARSKKLQITRIVKIVAQASFNAGVSAESINRFGGFVCAIIGLLEKNGVMVELEVASCGTGFILGGGSSVETITAKIKKSDEYMPTGQLLKCLSAGYFRRTTFAMITACAEALGAEVSPSLGSAFNFQKQWTMDGNKLVIYSAPNEGQQAEIINQLVSLVGLKQEGRTA